MLWTNKKQHGKRDSIPSTNYRLTEHKTEHGNPFRGLSPSIIVVPLRNVHQ